MRQTTKSHIQFIQPWDKMTHTSKQKIADSTEGSCTSANSDSFSGCTQSGTWQFLRWYLSDQHHFHTFIVPRQESRAAQITKKA